MAMQRLLSLDRTFRALADGTRRSMIHALARGEHRSASELGRQFRSAQPTISKHLKVLERAGLVERTIEVRVHRFRLHQRPLREACGWDARDPAFLAVAGRKAAPVVSGVSCNEAPQETL